MEREHHSADRTVAGPIGPESFPVVGRIEPLIYTATPPGGAAVAAGMAVWRYNNSKAEEALLHFTYLATYPAAVLGPVPNTNLQVLAMPTGIKQGSVFGLSPEEVAAGRPVSISTTIPSVFPVNYYGGNPFRAVRSLYLRPNTAIVIVMTGNGPMAQSPTPASFQAFGFIHGFTWINGTLRDVREIARMLATVGAGD